MGIPDTRIGGAARAFPQTSWSVVARLRDCGSADRLQLLQRLIGSYWKPVYCLIRRAWARTNEDAKDLTQEFFLTELVEGKLLERFDAERGNFRSFLKGAVGKFMKQVTRDAGRIKRGGKARTLSLQLNEGELTEVLTDSRARTPEEVFDRAWKSVVLARAVGLLAQRFRARGQEAVFEVFRRYDLEPESPDVSYQGLGRALRLGPDTVKNYLTRARTEFTRAVSDIVAEYVGAEGDPSAELAALFEK